ncbi:hypothetical protein GQR36_12960 [Enterococcus termitis]
MMIAAGIIILGYTNHSAWELIALGVVIFLLVFNLFLYVFLGFFVKEIIKTNEEIRIILFKGKMYSYLLSDWRFIAKTVINGHGKDRSSNHYLLLSSKAENKMKTFKVGLFTSKQREAINRL